MSYEIDRLSVSVKDFGAKGDGVTDDTTALNTAIASGAAIYAPPGTYIVDGVVITSGTTIIGAGINKTIFKLKSSSTSNKAFVTYNYASLVGTGSTGGVHSVLLSDFKIDGNKSANASGVGLAAYWYKSSIERVVIGNCGSYGITEEWGDFGDPDPHRAMENTYTDVTIHECDGAASWYHNGPHDSRFYGCSTIMGTGFAGIHVGERADGAMFVNCHPWGYAQVSKWPDWAVVFDGSNCMWCNSTAEGGSVGQILIRANDCSVVGGHQYTIINPNTVIGIQIGDSVNGFSNIAGSYIATKLTNFQSGFVIFNSDGGYSNIDVRGYATTSGSTITSGNCASTSDVNVCIHGPGGGQLQQTYWNAQRGAPATGQYPSPAYQASETLHATSKRASIAIGNDFQFIQDTAADGTRDFGIYHGGTNSYPIGISSAGKIVAVLPTSSSGLPSGALWCDTGAGNVVKQVP